MLTHPWAEHWPPKMGQVEQIHGGMGKSISQHLLGPHAPNFFWRFMMHIGTLFDHLGGVGTPMDRVSAPNMGQVEQIHGGMGKSISQHY